MSIDKSVFKAYDVRGIFPEQINPELAYLIGRAYGQVIKPEPKIVCVGRDVRNSGDVLFTALVQGLLDAGMEVVNLGTITTEMLYFAVSYYRYGGGIVITASHNPAEYNGFKMVRGGSEAISREDGGEEIMQKVLELAGSGIKMEKNDGLAHIHTKEIILDEYADHILNLVDQSLLRRLKPMTIAFNANHGYGGQVMKHILKKYQLPIQPVWLYDEVDGSFPQGRPDPLQEINQKTFAKVITVAKADFGVAWDADADRCFFFDSHGEFIDGYYIVGILAQAILKKYPNTKIIHDPRLTWATINAVTKAGGTPLVERVGHSLIKARMRSEDAVFAGENSGHYYFKELWYTDNGLLPFFLILELLAQQNCSIEKLVNPLREKYFTTGEINFTVKDADIVLEKIKQKYSDGLTEPIDGVSVEYSDWRFNLRKSNTEPLVRLNLEAKSKDILEAKKSDLLNIILSS